MQFVINNPYRILGLTANASSREVAKRVADLETFAEFGKIKKYPLDLVEILPLTRTVDTIQQAAKDIENDTDKLLYAFFWFAKVDSVDELAIECIENNQVQKAFEIWDQQISKNENDAKFSWRLNRAVISLFWCQGSNFDTDNFESALKDLGYLTDGHFQDVQGFIFGESNLKIDIEQINKKIIDEILKFISNLEEQPYGAYGIGLLHEFWTFSTSAQDYVQTKLFALCINQIETAIQKSQQLRDTENSSFINQYNGLKEVEDLIYEIDEFSENYKIQNILNEYVEEVRKCSLYANNKLDNRDLAYDLITWAEQLPSYGQVAEEVKVNKEQLIDLIENDKFSKHKLNNTPDFIQNTAITDNSIWICTPNGVYKNDLNTTKSKTYFTDQNISFVYKDKQQNYWVSTLNKGVLFIQDFTNNYIDLQHRPQSLALGKNEIFIGAENHFQ